MGVGVGVVWGGCGVGWVCFGVEVEGVVGGGVCCCLGVLGVVGWVGGVVGVVMGSELLWGCFGLGFYCVVV